ncbi:D-serine dehydratase [Bacillus sp. RC218]
MLNPSKTDFESFILASTLTRVDVIDAEDRLKRFAP